MAKSKIEGGCYCGNISVILETEDDPSCMAPRACDCAYCQKIGAAWLSDPNGSLEIDIQNIAAMNLFEQGSEQAKIWLCQRCGVVTAVTCEIEGQICGAINARCVDADVTFADDVTVSPKELCAEDKISRWYKVWTKGVVVKESFDVGL